MRSDDTGPSVLRSETWPAEELAKFRGQPVIGSKGYTESGVYFVIDNVTYLPDHRVRVTFREFPNLRRPW